jgi:hypothetical protein
LSDRGKKALLLRMDPDLYDALVTLAKRKDMSLNKLVNTMIREAVAREAAGSDDDPYPGNDDVVASQLGARLAALAEFQTEPGFDGYTREEIGQVLMNALGLTSARQAVRVMSRLIKEGVLVAKFENGTVVRYFINGSKLAQLSNNGSAGQGPAPNQDPSAAWEDRVCSGEQMGAHSGVNGR